MRRWNRKKFRESSPDLSLGRDQLPGVSRDDVDFDIFQTLLSKLLLEFILDVIEAFTSKFTFTVTRSLLEVVFLASFAWFFQSIPWTVSSLGSIPAVNRKRCVAIDQACCFGSAWVENASNAAFLTQRPLPSSTVGWIIQVFAARAKSTTSPRRQQTKC